MPHPQFNYLRLPEDSAELQSLPRLGEWLNQRFQRLANVMNGPKAFDAGVSGAAKTLKIHEVDLTTLSLTADCAVTLNVDSRRGAVGDLELTQDVIGGHLVTWVNALWAGGVAPVVAAGAGKRTLIRFINVRSAWVGAVHASNY